MWRDTQKDVCSSTPRQGRSAGRRGGDRTEEIVATKSRVHTGRRPKTLQHCCKHCSIYIFFMLFIYTSNNTCNFISIAFFQSGCVACDVGVARMRQRDFCFCFKRRGGHATEDTGNRRTGDTLHTHRGPCACGVDASSRVVRGRRRVHGCDPQVLLTRACEEHAEYARAHVFIIQ